MVLLFVLIQNCSTDNTIMWKEEEGYKWAELSVAGSDKVGFKLLSESDHEISFQNSITKDQILNNRVLLNGSGVAIGDVDGDGLADIYFCRLDGPNALYKNLGNWKFKDITEYAGVACKGQFSGGTAFADIDGDDDLDLLVISVEGPNACFLNDGTGKFTEIENAGGIASNKGASTMTLADIDGDEDLDLYIANYKNKSAKDIWDPGELVFNFVVEKIGDLHRINPKFQEHFVLETRDNWVFYFETGEPDMLFLNDGKGNFEKIPVSGERFLDENGKPVKVLKDWGLMARFQDMDNDGDPDIYVCNDFESPDRIWINDGRGYFQAIPKLAVRNTSNSSMSIDFSDVDRDGDLDYLVTDMLSLHHKWRMTQKNTEVPLPLPIGLIDNRPQYMKNTLFLNRGDNTYAEIAQFSGIQASEWSWSNIFLDVDLDGYEDMLVATGHYYDAQDMDAMMKANARIRMSAMAVNIAKESNEKKKEGDKLSTIFMFPKLELQNIAFHNRGDLTFEEVGTEWGFTEKDISHGMALGDLDNDGDLDMVNNRLHFPSAIYRNEASAPRIAVRLNGNSPNTQGIGAKVQLIGGKVAQSKEVISGGSYLSSSDQLIVFAANSNDFTINVKWRNGKMSTIKDVKQNRVYEIYEPESFPTEKIDKRLDSNQQPFFEDVSHLLKHKHHEDPFDDFQRQPLLPNRLSNLGPGVSWYDIDSDGDDDLIITGGKGGELALFRNDQKAGFNRMKDPALPKQNRWDQTSVLGWINEDGSPSLLVNNSNYENTKPGNSSVLQYDFKNGIVDSWNAIIGGETSFGPMTMADYDNDGDLDLFVGGRSIPARYPEPASSMLYQNQGDHFRLDSLNTDQFKKIGLVSGSIFSDFDGDGDPDLILAIEWGSVSVFKNIDGRFSDATKDLGLTKYNGWWHGVTTGDLNGDGKLDIIATNWGLNSKYQNKYNEKHPLQLYYDDFDNNGTLDIIETYFDSPTQKIFPVRSRNWILPAMPYLRLRMHDNRKYSYSTVQEIIGPKLKQAGNKKANTLSHMIFFNGGDRFEATELPPEAQYAPAFHAGVADFDGDGYEDIFLSQNFFATPVETARSDAGRGLWLKGNSDGSLTPVPGQESGIKVYGEQRGAAFGDYDQDGRVDLVVTQNAAETKIYHNVGAKPGLRVKLVGEKGNPYGVGASIRLIYEDGYGPTREIHSGSGYWSQDSMVQIMGYRDDVKGIWIRWPGGRVTESDIPENAKEVIVQLDGKITVK